ncbi:hypothetical protein EG68_11742 [Paragonimus skrjabini miyazakii]|uniref:Uncharacterized protein n=1 Tax=Paragonimus skrjabini miyazakii TaxID=59628 RepID=A0A8S9YFH8_9TREM|nr:hypothetical protein EG68_11742 [Paragonimus skrjabini miyazakii]
MSVDKEGHRPLLFSGGYRLKVLPCLLVTKHYCDGLQHAHTLASQLQSWQPADLVRLSVYLSTSTSCCFELSNFAYVEAKTMASELAATRMPLLQKQPHVEHFDLDSGNVTGYPSVYSSIHEPVIVGHPCTVSKAESTSIATGVMDSSNLGMSYVYSAGFRYQIRRPVESWKFIESDLSGSAKTQTKLAVGQHPAVSNYAVPKSKLPVSSCASAAGQHRSDADSATTVSVSGVELLTGNECVRAPQSSEFQ